MATWVKTIIGEANEYIPSCTGEWGNWVNLPSPNIRVANGMNSLLKVDKNEYARYSLLKVSFTCRHTGPFMVSLCANQPAESTSSSISRSSSRSQYLSGGSSSSMAEDVVTFDYGSPTFTNNPIYIAFENRGTVHANILFDDISVSFLIDDTPPIAKAITPTSDDGYTRYNYQATHFRVDSNQASAVPFTQCQIQCSYDNNDWSDLIVNQIVSPQRYYATYDVPAYTFHGGTVYWRCRVKTDYSDWGEWAYESFVAVENKVYISSCALSGPFSRYKDSTKPLIFSWEVRADDNRGVTINGARISYSLDYETWIELGTVEGETSQFTIPANTFPDVAFDPAKGDSYPYGGIVVKADVYNGNGVPNTSNGKTFFYTADSPISIVSVSPKNGASAVETSPITFYFTTNNAISTPPKDVDIRWKTIDSEWQYLEHLADSMTPGTGGGNPLANTVVIPANTFPVAVIYYQVRAYNQDDIAGDWSSEAYFSTIDAPSVSTPISPSGTIEDTDSDLVFRWSTSSTSGSTPTGADLQYSYDGITWLVLGHTDGTTQLTVSGGRIHAGTVQWQVRSYNRNGTPGAWSASATFVAHAAPRILDLITDDKPFTTFTWQATDQRDYHIVIDDDLVIGPVLDEVKTYQLTDYLEDGLHTVKIRVQNEMSVWSEWAETQFQVLNIPDGEIELQGSWDIDADLFWEDQATDAEYMVYRDGGLIGKTHSKAFSDRVVLGEHRYHVIRRLSDGCYSISNTVSGSMSTRLTRVAPLVGGEWLALVKSENAKRSERFTRRRKVAYHHFSGNKFPTPEIGDQEELIGEYDAAWMHTEEGAKILDSLVGQAIIVKSRSGKVIIGVLEGYTSGEKKHFSGFTFDLKQMDWEDYVCDI